ncbi:MAG: tetratricopeptide repeat protein [Candidatus Paceibacterota bacterium]|jgi:tetratricopeptide (TPR) repeat protein
MQGIKKLFSLEALPFGLLVGLVFLLPVFFLSVSGISLDVSKSVLAVILIVAATALWLVGRMVDGKIVVPKTLLVLFAALLPLEYLVSAVASKVPAMSLFGQGFEVGTFAFTFVMFLLLFLASILVNSRDKVFTVYVSAMASFLVVAIYQGIRLFAGADVLTLGGNFSGVIANTVGKWNDLGAFFGMIAILSMITLETLPLKGFVKYLTYLSLAVSVFFLAVVNFSFAWIALAVISLMIFVFAIYLNKSENPTNDQEAPSLIPKTKVPVIALVVLLISLFYVFSGDKIGGFLPTQFNASQVEVRPSWSATYDIVKGSLSQNLLLGSGPNRFSSEWALHRPAVLNETIFWATDFNAGIGLIPSFAVTTGLFGVLAWVLFLGYFLFRGVKSILMFDMGRMAQYSILSSFLLSVYLWLFAMFYVPNVVIYALAFLMTGVFIATLINEGIVKTYQISLLGSPKIGFVSVLALISLTIASAALGYVFVEKAISSINFQKTIQALNTDGDFDKAEVGLLKAVQFSENDLYYRSLSQVYLVKLNNLFQQQNLTEAEAKSQFQAILGNAIENARKARDYDATNYTNWMNLASVYESVVQLGVTGAYDEAKKAYEQASVLNPQSPLVYLTLARLEVANKDNKAARENLNKALALKSNYTDALFFLSQLEAGEGNIAEAISRADQASLLSPNDVGLFFQLGLLKYTNKDYNGAILSLERAVQLNGNYSNAMYFLGLSYDKVGRKADALAQFEKVEALNPDNQEVKNILVNLRDGKSALTDVPPPSPEKKSNPPVKEN